MVVQRVSDFSILDLQVATAALARVILLSIRNESESGTRVGILHYIHYTYKLRSPRAHHRQTEIGSAARGGPQIYI